MSRQEKSVTERNARTLRELVKQGDNKSCADCKKGDARWASWNLGCFLCIRCSGIHRSMGTHISKVKSIDLDIWTGEQMDSIKKWGNKRANLYWEAHLKAGHAPPDHKIESFIRSKYESRKWVLTDRIPSDPSVLEGNQSERVPLTQPQAEQNGGASGGRYDPPVESSSSRRGAGAGAGAGGRHPLLSSSTAGSRPPPMGTAMAPPKPKVAEMDLLGGDFMNEPTPAPAPAPTRTTTAPAPTPAAGARAAPLALGNPIASPRSQPPSATPAAAPTPTSATSTSIAAKPSPAAGLFDLDFKPPTNNAGSSAGGAGARSSTKDILSLYSSGATRGGQMQAPMTSPGFGDFSANPFGASQSQAQSQPQPQQQQQQQYQRQQAIYGQQGAYNAPPTYTSSQQAGYGSWGAGSGVTSAAGVSSSAAGGGGGVAGISSGFSGMSMGADPWSTPAAQPKPQQQQSNSSSSNHYLSSQDVWGGSAQAQPQPQAANGGYGGYGAPQQPQVQARKIEDDPFQNIWK